MLTESFAAVRVILRWQLSIIVLVSASFAVLSNGYIALQSALGGMAAFIPNVYLAIRLKQAQDLGAKKIVRAFYIGESGKLVLTALLFILILQLPQIELLPLMTGFVAVLSTFWFALLWRN